MAGRSRTCGAPRFRRALYRLSYGHARRATRPPSIPSSARGSTQRRAMPPSVCRTVETPALFSKPLAHPSTLDHRPSAAQARVVAVLRGGALEPDPRAVPQNRSANTHSICSAIDTRTRRAFLSRAGPRSVLVLLQLSITFSRSTSFASETTKATHPVAHERSRSAPGDLAHSTLLEGSHESRPV